MNYVCLSTFHLPLEVHALERTDVKVIFGLGGKSSRDQGPDVWDGHDNQGCECWRCHFPSTSCCSWLMKRKFPYVRLILGNWTTHQIRSWGLAVLKLV